MGGRSSSRQQTSNTQQTNNYVNDGEFAGVTGGVALDESTTNVDKSVEDSFNTTTEIDNDIDNSIEDAFNTTTSVDNSIENDGEFSGNSGSIQVLDGGAIDAAKEIAEESLRQNAANFQALNETTTKVVEEIGGVSRDAIRQTGETARDITNSALSFGGDAIEEVGEQASEFSESLERITEANISANQGVLTAQQASNTEDKALIAELAKNTSLAGQDIVAKSSERMVMFISIAIGLGFMAMAFTRGAK